MLAQLVTDSTVSFCPFQPVEFANEINVNKMLLLPEGVFIVWDYDWLVLGSATQKINVNQSRLLVVL